MGTQPNNFADGVVNSLLTGNIQANAAVKVGAFGLDRWLDFEAGAYGSDPHHDRSDLVSVALRVGPGGEHAVGEVAVALGEAGATATASLPSSTAMSAIFACVSWYPASGLSNTRDSTSPSPALTWLLPLRPHAYTAPSAVAARTFATLTSNVVRPTPPLKL